MEHGHSGNGAVPGAGHLHQDLVTLVEGRDQDSLVDVIGTVSDDGTHQELFVTLLAHSGNEDGVGIVRINDAVVVFWTSVLFIVMICDSADQGSARAGRRVR